MNRPPSFTSTRSTSPPPPPPYGGDLEDPFRDPFTHIADDKPLARAQHNEVSPSVNPSTINSPPRLLHKVLSITRFLLRAISLIFSIAGLALVMNSVAAYKHTINKDYLFNGEHIWPETGGVDMVPSHAMIAVFAVTLATSAIILIASAVARVVHADAPANIADAIAAITNLIMCLAGGLYFMLENNEQPTLRQWTCAHRGTKHPEIGMGGVCDEQRYAFAIAMVIVVLEALVMLNAMVNWVFGKHAEEEQEAAKPRGREMEL